MGSRLFALSAVAMLGCVAPQVPSPYPDVAPGRYEKRLTSGGILRTYILRVPPAYDKTRPTPLVVVYHGWTGSGPTAEIHTRMGPEADRAGWISVFPDGTNNPRGWNAGFLNLGQRGVDDVQFTKDLLDEVAKTVNVDPSRIYIAGHSNGAMMAHLLGSKLSDRVAAIAAVAGTIGLTAKTTIEPPKAPISVLMIHGRIDPMVAYDASASALLKGIGALDSARWWATQDGAATNAVETPGQGGDVTDRYTMGKNGTEVELISLAHWPHDWPVASRPGGIDAARTIIEFFGSHPKKMTRPAVPTPLGSSPLASG